MKKREEIDVANHSEYMVIKEAASQIENAFDPDKAIHTILSLISRQMGLNRGRVLLQEKVSGYLYTAYAYGLTQDEISRSRFAVNEGITGKVMSTGAPVIISDIDKEEDYLCRTVDRSTLPQEKVAFIATPILRKGSVIGVLAVNRLSNRMRALDRDLNLLKMISVFISEILAVNALLETQTQILKEENEQLKALALSQGSQYGIIGESRSLMAALNKVSRAANATVTVLLKGESGTGKERFSRMLHLASKRQDGPFVAINCAAIPQELLESELFGHEKGAFTGATQAKKGKIELANHGTLFLDEIGDLDFGLQAKLLRVLEERAITRVGATKPIPIDTRIIVASHKDLHEAVNQGRFRLDLFYRLNVFPIELPALRERDGDIRLLARHFLNIANQEYQTSAIFDHDAMKFLEQYDWPGNIRQLENVVKRAVLMADESRFITLDLISKIIREESGVNRLSAAERTAPVPSAETLPEPVSSEGSKPDYPFGEGHNIQSQMDSSYEYQSVDPLASYSADGKRAYWKVSEDEKGRLQQALRQAHGNKTRAALLLGMTPRQFGYRLKKLEME
ncbi:sigma 54-interacting transcriptional regulator [Thiomicrorhabdus sp. zzn3]|uniref:sigma-54 interaction domain-containing protein n=1 Tax=Thiomicrorhabdus sp. zzn3 TaxID=3039775 RepID=UPI0024372A4B|nr:sigma 54-interacting transcriptional regulator [Thiomicrorhabdus sp. zzn3]MDG6778306.1 sigma 54-interacting transcriptional regulator [Thiomicrorhabdus sp. zzn3]